MTDAENTNAAHPEKVDEVAETITRILDALGYDDTPANRQLARRHLDLDCGKGS